jgi:hypothetical protein
MPSSPTAHTSETAKTSTPAPRSFSDMFSWGASPSDPVPEKRPWWCRVHLHQWSRWGAPQERIDGILNTASFRYKVRYQRRECLNCGIRQERTL